MVITNVQMEQQGLRSPVTFKMDLNAATLLLTDSCDSSSEEEAKREFNANEGIDVGGWMWIVDVWGLHCMAMKIFYSNSNDRNFRTISPGAGRGPPEEASGLCICMYLLMYFEYIQ